MRTSIHIAVSAAVLSAAFATPAVAAPVDADPIATSSRAAKALDDVPASPIVDVAQVSAGGRVDVGGGPAPVTSDGDSEFPRAYVDRPLTLRKFMLSPEFSLPITHLSLGGLGDINAVGLNLGAAFGIINDLTVDVTPLTLLIVSGSGAVGNSTTKVYYGTFRLGATYRFIGKDAAALKSDVVEMGARVEFGATGANDTIHLGWGLPIIIHAGHIFRLDTGIFFTALFPTNGATTGTTDPDIAMASVGSTAPSLALGFPPGIPIDITLGNDFIFGGVDTGFGIGSFRGSVDKNAFMPLGFHFGGTIPSNNKPLLDLVGNFGFPLFLLGSNNKLPTTQVWQVGLDARAYFQL